MGFLDDCKRDLEEMKNKVIKQAGAWGERVFKEARRNLSGRGIRQSESALNEKTGRLKRSLEKKVVVTPNGIEVIVGIDMRKAGNSRFAILGTRYIKPRDPIGSAMRTVGDNIFEEF